MCYSVQSRGKIFVKGYGFLSFAESMGKNIGKNINKTWVVNKANNFLIIPNNSLQIHLKMSQKEQFKKQQKQLMS